MGVNFIATLWGFAEATLFFIVPDVWTSSVALKDLKSGLVSCLWASCGALAGGLIMYWWGWLDFRSAWEAVELVPAVSQEMMSAVSDDLSRQGIFAVLFGPLSGTPYKVYAIQAHQMGLSVTAFLLISIPARLIRFLIVTTIVHMIARRLLVYMPFTRVRIVFIGAWVAFYVFYFSMM